MAQNWNYRIDGTALVPTYCDHVRLMEGVAGKRAQQLEVAYQHGVYVADRHWSKARLMRLDTLLPGGTPSQIYTALQGLYGLLLPGKVTLTRADPVLGDVQCECLVSEPVQQPEGAQRFQWNWPVWQLSGFWEDATATQEVDTGFTTTGTIGPISVGGTHPTEPVFTITCTADGANPAVTDPATGDSLTVIGNFVTSDVIVVDVPARTVTLNGTRAKALLSINRGWWMEWAAGATISLDFTADSGTWNVTTDYRNRHR